MSKKDYLNIAIKNIFRNKRNAFYIIITIICTILALGTLTFYTNITKYVENEITKNVGYRTLIVFPNPELEDLGFKKLSDIDHVEEIYSARYDRVTSGISDFKNEYLDGGIGLVYGSENTLPKVVSGRSFKSNETGIAICPVKFFPDSSNFNLDIDEKHIIDGNSLLGKSFTVTYINTDSKEKIDKSFKIVGLYDNTSLMRLNNECFIAPKDIMNIVDFVNPLARGEFDSFNVLVDDLNNVSFVNDEARESLGFAIDFYTQSTMDFETVNFLKLSSNILLSVVLFVIILVTLLYMKKKLFKESKIIGILRTCGYDNKKVTNIYFLEIALTNIISFIIGLIIFLIILFILMKTLLSGVIYYGIDISLTPVTLIFSLIIILIPTIIARYNINKKCKLNITDLIGNDE